MSDEETWLEALDTYEKLAMGRRKVELTSIIRPILERLQREAQTVGELRARYHAGDEQWPQIVRTGSPDQPRLWEEHRTPDAAYGIRYRQLVGQARERPGRGVFTDFLYNSIGVAQRRATSPLAVPERLG